MDDFQKIRDSQGELDGNRIANLLVDVPLVVTMENPCIREGLESCIFSIRETPESASTNPPEFEIRILVSTRYASDQFASVNRSSAFKKYFCYYLVHQKFYANNFAGPSKWLSDF